MSKTVLQIQASELEAECQVSPFQDVTQQAGVGVRPGRRPWVASRPKAGPCRLRVFVLFWRVAGSFCCKGKRGCLRVQLWLAGPSQVPVQVKRQSKSKDRAHWFPPWVGIAAFVELSGLFDCMRVLCRSGSSPASWLTRRSFFCRPAMRPECAPILSLADSTAVGFGDKCGVQLVML